MDNGRGLLRSIVLPAATFVLFVFFWQIAVEGGIAPVTIAAPSHIAATVIREWDILWFHMEPTL